MDKVYPTDLTDEQWAIIQSLLPPAKHGGRPRTVDLRLVLNTIFYLNKTGCQWAMLPKNLAKRSSANNYFVAWQADGTWQAILDALRQQVRVAAGHEPQPQKAAIDSQTVKGSEAGGARGYDGGKKINGRKRHLLVIRQVTLGVVDEERVAGARPVGRAHDVHPIEVRSDVRDDVLLIHRLIP